MNRASSARDAPRGDAARLVRRAGRNRRRVRRQSRRSCRRCPSGARGGAGGSAVVHDGPDVHVTINELMAKNALTVQADGNGLASSWVELYSDAEQEIPLAGYALTDDFANPGKGPIGEGVVLPPHGRVVLWLDGDTAAGPTHVAATLLKIGGTLGLARPDGSFVARVSYGAQEVDFSAAREPDGSDHWAIEWHPTPGAPNATGTGQPMGPSAPDAPPEAVPAAGDLTETILGFDRMPELALDDIGRVARLAAARAPDLRPGDAQVRRSRLRTDRGEAEGAGVVRAHRSQAVVARQHRRVRARGRLLRPQGPDPQQHARRLLDDARAARLLGGATGRGAGLARQPRAADRQRQVLRPLLEPRDRQEAPDEAALRRRRRHAVQHAGRGADARRRS